jgi:hypothetical protein
LQQHVAALAVPDDGCGLVGRRVEDRERVAGVGLPRIQRGVLAVAVAAVVPGDHAPARVGEQGREDVVGAREIEAAVGEEERPPALVAPFVDVDPHAPRVDVALAVRGPGSRKGDGVGRGHEAHICITLGATVPFSSP